MSIGSVVSILKIGCVDVGLYIFIIFKFFNLFFIIVILGVHCDIYKSFYKIS
jgi:hypothetical protein